MPIYEYFCFDCDMGKERLRAMDRRNEPLVCDGCNNPMELCISAPAFQVWDADRSFPNLTSGGDGSMTFASKDEYHAHLKANGIDEASTDAPVYRPHGNKTVGTWK